jgi:hypothetical protein
MRTTLTLDDDVAVLLERFRKSRGLGLKEAVNDALRLGLKEAMAEKRPRAPYRTPSTSLGGCLLGNLDDISEVLALAEGEQFR